MQRLVRLVDILTLALAVIAGVAVIALMLHVTFDVVMRGLFKAPPTGTIVFVSNYYMVLVVCLPLALVEMQKGHISVDVVTGLLPGEAQKHLNAWTLLVSATIFGVVAWASWQEALAQYKLGKFVIEGGIKFSTWYGYFAMPLGYGFGAVYMGLNFLKYLVGFTDHPTPPERDDDDTEEFEKVMYD